MTSEQGAWTARAPQVIHMTTAHGLSAGGMQLHHDEHGASHIYLDEDRHMGIRIQVDAGRYDTPEQHAADLERDRQGLLRLAAVATQLAEEIGQRQREGGAA
jgi:hypothetical protein